MNLFWKTFKAELTPTVRLAAPVVAAELGWMAMGIVDTIMVGRLGAEAIGGVSIGNILFFAVNVCGLGLLLGMDTLVSQAYGAGDLHGCHRTLIQAGYISVAQVPLLMILVLGCGSWLEAWQVHPDVRAQAIPYLEVAVWSTLPLLAFAALRRHLQGMGLVKPIMFTLLAANLVNVAANYVLIFGHLGFPAMGVAGAALATCASRTFLAVSLFAYVAYREMRCRSGLFQVSLKPEWVRIARLLKLGGPAAMQVALEFGVFGLATVLAGRLDPAALAAHQIALNVSGVTFMVPLGISAAGAVRVGHALGRRDPQAAGRCGWMAILLGGSFMALAALALPLLRRPIMLAFTNDARAVALGGNLLLVAAVFQLFDGLQVVATGVLRGAGDTRIPMLCNLVGHWVLGLPLGYVLCFRVGWGVFGLWIGLCAGLIAVGAVLLWTWAKRAQALKENTLQKNSAA